MRGRRGLTLTLAALMLAACGNSVDLSADATEGRRLVDDLGCVTCHSGRNGVGPSWEGAWGTSRRLEDGSTAVFDSEYVRLSLSDPVSQLLEGYPPIMPTFSLSEAQLAAIIAFLEEA